MEDLDNLKLLIVSRIFRRSGWSRAGREEYVRYKKI